MNSRRPIKWKRRKLLIFFERLELYVSSGLSVDRALEAVAMSEGKRQAEALRRARQSVESGRTLTASLASSIRLPPLAAGLIGHGEASGTLHKALGAARLLLEKQDELIKKCASAMAYPSIIGAFAILLTIGLTRGVMPQITPMLLGLQVDLPILTRLVIAFSGGLVRWGGYVALAAPLLAMVFLGLYRKKTAIRRFVQSVLLRIPLLGSLMKDYSLAVFLQSFGSLVETGLPASEAYVAASGSVSLIPLRANLQSRSNSIAQGSSVAAALSAIRSLPPHVVPLVSAGETSGFLGASLSRSADIIDRDVSHQLKKLTALVEPVMMAGMGCAVGAIALSIMMPIYDVSKILQH